MNFCLWTKRRNPGWDSFHVEEATTDSSPKVTEQHLSQRFLSVHQSNFHSPKQHLNPPNIIQHKEHGKELITGDL